MMPKQRKNSSRMSEPPRDLLNLHRQSLADDPNLQLADQEASEALAMSILTEDIDAPVKTFASPEQRNLRLAAEGVAAPGISTSASKTPSDSSNPPVYDTWLPGYGKVLKITAIWSGDQPPATARFTLANTSSYAGRAVNDPDPSLSSTNYPIWYNYSGFDFGLTTTDPTTDPNVHSFAQGPISVSGTGVGADTVYTVFLQCWDYGGRARIIVTHPTDSSISSEIWIPNGSGTNGIGSSWQHGFRRCYLCLQAQDW